ncbi:MAG: phytanoyl-CoA dioxygenase family protein [Rhodocyclaceae bacterium]|nr:phytanoyl-CoA dioxygenase family protein [Rhodocyclaceae bacterium]
MSAFLSPEQLQQFRRDGYLVLPGMVTADDCARMRVVVQAHLQNARAPLEYEAEVGYPGAPDSLDAPGGRTVRRLKDAYHRDTVLRAWAEDARIVTGMQQLLEEPVMLTLAHHNCVMTKHPHYGTATGWHRDIRYWRFMRNELITVWLALGDERVCNGALRVIPGSHRFDIKPEQLDALDFLRPDAAENAALFAQGIPVELQAGDVLLFHSGLFHAAGPNQTDAVKMSVAFAYRGASNLPLPGSRSSVGGDVALEAAVGEAGHGE